MTVLTVFYLLLYVQLVKEDQSVYLYLNYMI